MRWKAYDVREWRRVFAWLPMVIGDEEVWLEYVEKRAKGWDPTIGLYGEEYRKIQ